MGRIIVSFAQRALLVLAYAAAWTANRWPAIRANTLFFDDYAIPGNTIPYYIGSYRPASFVEYHLFHAFIPNFLWSHWPKILGALYTGLAAMALALLLRKWGVAASLAAAIPLVMIVNPVLADGALWSSGHILALGLYLAIEAARAERWWAICALTLVAACFYQVFVAVPVLLLVAEWSGGLSARRNENGGLRARRSTFTMRMSAVAAAAILQLAIMTITKLTYAGADARGVTASISLAGLWHGVTGLLANGWMPAIAYYTGALTAMSLWWWVPIVLAAANAIAMRGRRLAAAAATLLILGLPTTPILISTFYPDAWRVAIPTAVALAAALVPSLAALPRAISMCAIAVLVAVMAPVSWYESAQRVVSFERDRALVRSMATPRVGFGSPIAENPRNAGPHELTWGFNMRTPAMWTMFFDERYARPFLENYHGRKWSEVRECRCGPFTKVSDVTVVCGQSPPCRP